MWHETEEFRNFNVFKNIYAAKAASDAREVERGVPSPVEVGFGERLGKYKSSELLNTIYGQLAVMRWGLKRDGGSAREGS